VNLLIALNVILEERNVTRAADRLGLTQSARRKSPEPSTFSYAKASKKLWS
jgi:hypothetical protein